MNLSRRGFLKYATASGLGIGLGATRIAKLYAGASAASRPLSVVGNRLGIPPTFSGETMVAAVGTQTVWPGSSSDVWTFGGSYPAPTIRAKHGEEFRVRLVNNLLEPTNIHWHGLTVPAAMDGYPRDVAGPGGTFEYAFTVAQRAGTYWYHPHPDMRTGPQVYMGMAGFLIVEDDEERALDLPGGNFDIPLMLQDRRLTPERTLAYDLRDEDHLEGYLGDVMLANGMPDAYLDVEAGLYRFRILNGSNSRVLDLALSDASPMLLIGTDGGLLDRPYEVGYIYLAPAERVDVLIDFSRFAIGQTVTLKSLAFSGGSGRVQGTEMSVIRFDVARPASSQRTVPAVLATYERLDPVSAVRTRKFTLRIDHTSTPEGHTINDLKFDMARIDERVEAGTTEIWVFENVSFLHHPMHIHGVQFQVLKRSLTPKLEPRDLGWKDTVYVRPYEVVEVLVRFPESPGVFLVHCHNLEHEDHGMMLNFEITAGSSGVSGGSAVLPERMKLE